MLSKTVYQSQFHKPPAAQATRIQRAVNKFVASSQRPEEQTPNSWSLYPKAATCHLPDSCGGLGLLDIEAQVPSLLAKPCWQHFSYNVHPWAELFSHEIALAAERRRGVVPAIASSVQDPQPDQAQDSFSGLPPGSHWIVTCPEAGRPFVDTIVTPSTRSSVEAFLGLGCSRIVKPSDMDTQSILLELTFHNPVIQNRTSSTVQDPASLFLGAPTAVQAQDQAHVQDPAAPSRSSREAPSSGLAPSMLSSPAARTWNRLRTVQAAFIDRDRLSSLELQDLRFILALPEPWRAAVCNPRDHSPDWRVVSALGAALTILEGPDPMFVDRAPPVQDPAMPRPTAPILCWLLIHASGQLVRYTDPFNQDPTYVPRPALVVLRPMPKKIFKREHIDFLKEQLRVPARDRRVLLQPRLVGIWDEMQLDPRVWGLPASAFLSVQAHVTPHRDQDDYV